MRHQQPDTATVEQAAQALIAGELVAMPTETVYGLAADAGNRDAVDAIYRLKGRPPGHPLIVHVSSLDKVSFWAELAPDALKLARAFWPGPLTLIARRAEAAPPWACGGHPTVGVRVPSHPVAQALLREFERLGGQGIAAPSANRFGRISPTRAAHVRDDFGVDAPLILDGGASAVGVESTIVDVSGERAIVLRPGGIDAAALAQVLGLEPASAQPNETVSAAPGTLAAHYAPLTRMKLVDAGELAAEVARQSSARQKLAVYAQQAPGLHDSIQWRPMPADAQQLARQLYDDLRALDAMAADLIIVQAPPAGTAYAAIADRLQRAQTGSSPLSQSR